MCFFWPSALALLIGAGTSSSHAESSIAQQNDKSASVPTPQTEVYGTASDGTVLHWVVYQPSTPGPWPAVLVIHGGGFFAGSPDSSLESVVCAQDLAAAGYIAFSIEYRLAPPGALPGQISDGRFPDQSDDVKLAMRTARADPALQRTGRRGWRLGRRIPHCFLPLPGDDWLRPASTSASAFRAPTIFPIPARIPTCHTIPSTVTNYVNAPSTDMAAMRVASSGLAGRFDNVSPLFMVNTPRRSYAVFPTGRYDRCISMPWG